MPPGAACAAELSFTESTAGPSRPAPTPALAYLIRRFSWIDWAEHDHRRTPQPQTPEPFVVACDKLTYVENLTNATAPAENASAARAHSGQAEGLHQAE